MPSTSAAQAYEQLNTAFPGRVVNKETGSQYTLHQQQPWSQTCWAPAAAYLVLNTAEEVALALTIVREVGCRFALRTSGHNPNAGFSSADETGIVFDLGGLDDKVLGDDGVLHAGCGNRWGQVYSFLQEKNLSPIGGRDVEVGLGGFLTGGGYPPFASLYGTGPDSVRGYQVVIADGTIIEANRDTNSDLWRALKAGTSNFGVVTRFDIDTYPVIKAQYSITLYNPEDFTNINAASLSVQEEMEKDPRVNMFTNFNKGFVAVFQLYADCAVEKPKAFQPFDKLTSKLNSPLPMTNGTVLSFVETLSQMGHIGGSLKRKIGTITTRNSAGLYNKVYEYWRIASNKLPAGAVLHYTIQPLSTLAVQASIDRSGGALGLEKVPQNWWVFTAEWPQGLADSAAVEHAHDELLQTVEFAAQELGLLLDFKCPSFAGAKQNVMAGIGQEMLKLMHDVSAKYDSEGVFQKLQYNGFLLRYTNA